MNGKDWPFLDKPVNYPPRWHPSTSWEQGGPLIDKHQPALIPICNNSGWCAEYDIQTPGGDDADTFSINGPTILVAAMRAIVASELGDRVKVPAEPMEATHE